MDSSGQLTYQHGCPYILCLITMVLLDIFYGSFMFVCFVIKVSIAPSYAHLINQLYVLEV